jgi:mannosylglycerate hydrolase
VVREYTLPAACAADRASRSAERVEYTVTSDVSLVAGARRVEITTTVENTARDHRLRVLFPVPFVAACAAAEDVFDVTTRPASQPKPSADETESWAELPVDTHPQKRFVDIHDTEHGLGMAVLNRGLPEYEIVPGVGGQGSAIALTLLRCVEWLSREDLSTRRGHAGAKLYTPGAQGLATHVFEYALVPHAGTWTSEDALVLHEAEAFEEPMRALATERHFGQLRDMWSFVHVAPASVAVSAVKRVTGEDGLIVRLYNSTREDTATELILALPFREVVEVNLSEAPVSDAEARDLARILSTGVRTTVRAGEIVTLLFRMAGPTA